MTDRRTRSDRDGALGAALRALETPDHHPDFFDELRERLEAARPDRPAAPAPVRSRRRSRRGRRSAANVARSSRGRRSAGNVARSSRGRRSAPRTGRLLPRLAIAGALAAVLLVVTLVREGDGPGPRLGAAPATAADVRAKALHAWAALRSLTGVLTVRRRDAEEMPVTRSVLRFALTDRGDLELRGAGGYRAAYDAATGTEVVVDQPQVPGPGVVRRGLAPAAPDAHPSEEVLQRGLAAVVRSLRDAPPGGSLENGAYRGRPAWVLRMPVAINKLGWSADRLEVTVDKATGLPVHSLETRAGKLVQDVRLSRLRADAPIVTDDGYRPRARGPVLAAAWTPAGYRRAETVAAADAQSTGAEGMNPRSRDVVATAWRRGLDRLVITTRSTGPTPRSWEDPLAPPEGYLASPQRVRLTAGALAGATAQVLIDPRAVPHLWVLTRERVVTVSGDLTRAELLRVANGLRVR
jgi:hypothetical protein